MPQTQERPSTKYAHSFPKTVLQLTGHKIYVNNQQILTAPIKHPYKPKPLKTFLFLGQDIAEEPENKKYMHISVERLKQETNYTVVSRRVGNKAWFPSQKVYYYITRQKSGLRDIIKPNIHHYIEHDEFNKRVRGLGDCFANPDGKSGRTKTDWVYYDPPPKTMPKRIWQGGEEELIQNIEDRWMGQYEEEEQERVLEIKELPVMITNNNYLLCIPKHPGGSKDIQRILFVGQPGYGKSFALNSILGRIYYCWDDLIGMLNDVLGQFHYIGIPNKSPPLKSILRRIGNEPRPLPAVYHYMSAPGIKMPHYEEGIGFRQVVSLYDFLGRYTFFTHGVKRWALEGKEKYLIESKKELSGCKTIKEFETLLSAKFGGEASLSKDKGTRAMITKMRDAFSEIYAEEFLDSQFLNEPGTAPQWKLIKSDGETLIGHPFIISAEAELLPVMDTTRASEMTSFRNRMADILQKILAWQIERKGLGKQRRFWVGIDELQTVYELGKKRDNAAESLERIFRQGRFNQIGFLGNTQSYEKLHEDIRKYNTHLFCTNIPSSKERGMIQKDYNLSKDQADELGRLEKFEFLAISKEPWVTYDTYGRRRVYKNAERTFRGKIIPPSQHPLKPMNKDICER